MNDQDHSSVNMVDLTGSIISAYVSNNRVSISELPALITATHAALKNVNKPPVVEPEKPTPPVPIRRTVTPDHIISLEDGKPYKSLKRHLSTRGLTPDQYRQKWGLPPDYPMVAATYAAQRSELAKSLGLGQIRRDRASARAAEEQAGASAGRGRPKKTS